MRIRDWSSDVCSSDLRAPAAADRARYGDIGADAARRRDGESRAGVGRVGAGAVARRSGARRGRRAVLRQEDRQSGVTGKSVSVRVDIGGWRSIKKKTK